MANEVKFTDVLISFGLRFDNLGDIILDFVERILPFDLPSLDELLCTYRSRIFSIKLYSNGNVQLASEFSSISATYSG